eukprot:5383121-Prymnesium_polylepis.1
MRVDMRLISTLDHAVAQAISAGLAVAGNRTAENVLVALEGSMLDVEEPGLLQELRHLAPHEASEILGEAVLSTCRALSSGAARTSADPLWLLSRTLSRSVATRL